MGAFDAAPNILLPDPNGGEASKAYREKYGEDATAEQEFRAKWRWEAHEVVILKGVYTTADQEIVENAGGGLKGQGKKSTPDMRIGSSRAKLLEVMIRDWTFTMGGRKQEVSRNAIAHLPSNYRTPILERIDEIAEPMSEEEQEDFLPGSNGHTKESSDEMSPFPTSA